VLFLSAGCGFIGSLVQVPEPLPTVITIPISADFTDESALDVVVFALDVSFALLSVDGTVERKDGEVVITVPTESVDDLKPEIRAIANLLGWEVEWGDAGAGVIDGFVELPGGGP